jgi:hypothetical protein
MVNLSVSLDELTAAVLAQPRPILFLDTASIIDTLRVPYHMDLQDDIFDATEAVVRACAPGTRSVWALATENVRQEVTLEMERACQELEKSIALRVRECKRFSKAAQFVLPQENLALPTWDQKAIYLGVQSLLDGLIASLTIYQGSPDCGRKAGVRVWKAMPPSRRSRQEFKDCVIFEEFLELVTTLRQQGFTSRAIFITSNRESYGDPPIGHPVIAEELEAAGA